EGGGGEGGGGGGGRGGGWATRRPRADPPAGAAGSLHRQGDALRRRGAPGRARGARPLRRTARDHGARRLARLHRLQNMTRGGLGTMGPRARHALGAAIVVLTLAGGPR